MRAGRASCVNRWRGSIRRLLHRSRARARTMSRRASEMSPEQRTTMVRGMVARLAERLQAGRHRRRGMAAAAARLYGAGRQGTGSRGRGRCAAGAGERSGQASPGRRADQRIGTRRLNMTRKQRRLVLIGSSLGVLALAAVLVLSALKDFDRVLQFADRRCGEACAARQPHPARRAGQGRHRAARRQSRGALRGDRRQPRHHGQLSRHPAGPVPRRAGRHRGRNARTRRRIQGRFGAGQARRELYAEGSRRRAEEAGPLGRGRPGRRNDRGNRPLRAGAGAGACADPVGGADCRRAAARRHADGRRRADRARAIRVRRDGVCRADRLLRHVGFLRRQRVREFAFGDAAGLQVHQRVGQP